MRTARQKYGIWSWHTVELLCICYCDMVNIDGKVIIGDNVGVDVHHCVFAADDVPNSTLNCAR